VTRDSDSLTRHAAPQTVRRQTLQAELPVRFAGGVDADRYRSLPTHACPAGVIDVGMAQVAREVEAALRDSRTVILDGVAAAFWEDIVDQLHAGMHDPESVPWIDVREAMRSPTDVERMLRNVLPAGDIFGRRFDGALIDFFDPSRLDALRTTLTQTPASIVYGPGAQLVLPEETPAGESLTLYADVARNEQQYRARAQGSRNLAVREPLGAKEGYRRAYFVDWVVEERHLARLLPHLDRFLDTQRVAEVTSMRGDDLRRALHSLTERPFRVRPWFEPGVWGGRWIQEHVEGLDPRAPNYAWSFELIVPENGVLFASEGVLLEVPFHALHAQEYAAILGRHAERFRDLFPIRFDWLDTVDGANLSLQCHPRSDYMRREFGEPFTQDETYYVLHAEPNAEVYLGFQDGVDAAAFRSDLEASAENGAEVDVRAYVQTHPARRGDLFLIPGGTVHCSGRGSLVLEISATPYIFTFKMYDWLRVDLDGRPRPLNVARAFDNLDFSRQGDVVSETLLSHPKVIETSEGGRVVHLPTHPEHFYDVHRLELTGAMDVTMHGSPHVLAVVAGAGVTIDVGGRAERYAFAETIVLPARVERYRLIPHGDEPVEVVKAFLK